MIDVNAFMLMILYMSLIILVVMLIVIAYRTIKLMKKVDQIIDDISIKSSKLNGVFNIIDTATDTVVQMNDTIVSFITSGLERLFNRKREKKDE